jgi:hypothetical protein
MLIDVTQDDITLGQANNSGLSRGASCPIARAVARTLGVSLYDVYTTNSHVEVYWTRRHQGWESSLDHDYQRTFYDLDVKGGNFIAQADNSDGYGCSGSDSPKPTTLVLRQHPLHCSLAYSG